MTYSCAVFDAPRSGWRRPRPPSTSWSAPSSGSTPGMRLLDVGCGWGSMAIHAARNHGVRVVGVTLSEAQHEWATKQVVDIGLGDIVEVRLQDYREVADGPFDAISSIGMFEHVGRRRMAEYFSRLHALLRPGAGSSTTPSVDRGVGPATPSATRSAPRHTGWVSPPASGGPRGSPARSWTATSSPTGSSTRSGRWSR